MMAVKRPGGNATMTSSRARTAVSPRPYTLVACDGPGGGGAVAGEVVGERLVAGGCDVV